MSSASTHHLLLYTYVPDMAERRGPHREAHLANIRAGQQEGRIVMAGATGEPPTGGAIAFRDATREEIEAFVRDDPYVHAGLVSAHRIEPWTLV